jgi:excisionase family DNA binding protein
MARRRAIAPPPQLLTPQDVADLLKVHVMTIRRYVAAGRLECVRLENHLMRFTPTQVDDFLTRTGKAAAAAKASKDPK